MHIKSTVVFAQKDGKDMIVHKRLAPRETTLTRNTNLMKSNNWIVRIAMTVDPFSSVFGIKLSVLALLLLQLILKWLSRVSPLSTMFLSPTMIRMSTPELLALLLMLSSCVEPLGNWLTLNSYLPQEMCLIFKCLVQASMALFP
jgi:hypothetical protein